MNFARLTSLGFISLIVGCHAVGPDYHKPDPILLAEKYPAGDARAVVEAQWWKNFHDVNLTRLIEAARIANFDIHRAEANLREARALAKSVELGDFSAELRNSTAVAGWELDLFGKLRRGQESADASVEAAEANRDAVLISISAEVATAYLEYRGAQQSLHQATKTVEGSIQMLALCKTSLQLGRSAGFDIAQVESQLAENRATLPLINQTREVALSRLAVLAGCAPGTLHLRLDRSVAIPTLPDSAAVGLPADLLRNRPDVRAAERSLAAAVADIGVQTADLYPHFSLGGSLSYSVGKPSGFLWNGGPNLSWAAFDLPRVRTHIAAAQARADAALANYQQTVLQAAEEAGNALSAWQHQRERRDLLRFAVAQARTHDQQAHKRMEAGVVALPNVIEIEQTRSRLEMQLTESETKTATSLINVYKSVGGGWQR